MDHPDHEVLAVTEDQEVSPDLQDHQERSAPAPVFQYFPDHQETQEHPVSRVCPVTKDHQVFEDTKVTLALPAQLVHQERRDCQDRTDFKEPMEMLGRKETKDQSEPPEALVIQEHAERSDNRDDQDKMDNLDDLEQRETPELTELLPVNLDRRESPVNPVTTDQSDSKDQPVQ